MTFTHPIGAQLTVDALTRNPYPLFQQMHTTAPICWAPAFHLWMVTRRADVITILRDAETYTMEPAGAQINPMADIFGPMMLSIDGPEHKAIRDVFAEPFRARLVQERYQLLIAAIAEKLIDELPDRATVDLDKAFADELAIYTIVAALGLDIDNAAQFREWYDDFAIALGNTTNEPALRQQGKRTFAHFHALVTAQIARVRQEPNASVLSHIVHHNTHNLSHDQIVSNIALTFFGGVETASALLANTIWALLRHPEQCAEVRQDPKLMAAAIAESLRWEAPVQSAMRFPTRDVTLHDVPIKAGEKIYCMLGAANRDPAFFPEPDRFDIHRPNADKHLSFAYGPHYCFGAPLALLEGEIGLTILLQRLPEVQLHPDHLTAPRGHEFRAMPTLLCAVGKKR
ncbi:MAG: cytochrome P450 [Caldilineaceae bacterium]|nr:cytochrome P450 [Caldilineaceae bacterium]